jgi:hypothetical protein
MRVMASPRPNQENPMSKATIPLTQDDVDRAERRRAKLILDYRNIGIFIEEDTPLDEIPRIDQITRLRMLATKHRRPIGHLDLTNRAAVNRELDRLQMLEGGTRRRGSYRTIRAWPRPREPATPATPADGSSRPPDTAHTPPTASRPRRPAAWAPSR